MDQLMQQVQGMGFSEEQLKGTVGAVLSFLKSQNVDMNAVKGAIPQATELLEKAEVDNSSAGNCQIPKPLLAFCDKMKLGDENPPADRDAVEPATPEGTPIESPSQLLKLLGSQGVEPKKAVEFLPIFSTFLKEKAGVDVGPILDNVQAGNPLTKMFESAKEPIGKVVEQAKGLIAGAGTSKPEEAGQPQ